MSNFLIFHFIKSFRAASVSPIGQRLLEAEEKTCLLLALSGNKWEHMPFNTIMAAVTDVRICIFTKVIYCYTVIQLSITEKCFLLFWLLD